jgi:protein involved in polysaccharide export with SLBB domain
MKYFKLLILMFFFSSNLMFSQTYEEITKLRNQYNELKKSQLNEQLNSEGDILLKEEQDKGPTRVIYKPEDLEEFYRQQLSQLTKSLEEINSLNSFFDSTKSLSHFGYNLFTNRDTISFFENIPLPSNYILGSGDELIVSLWGQVEKEETSIINRDGNIFFEDIGIIELGGLTLDESKIKLKNAFSKTYSTIKNKNPSTFLDISLGELKGLNVHILGFVNSPGVYALHPFSDPFTALFYAGGVDTSGTLRNIEIYRDGKKVVSVDLYNIIFGGSLNKQIRLLDQDIIFVPPRKSKVIINGAVQIPGYFELIESERADDLVNYSGGLTSKASNLITLKRVNSPYKRKNDDLAIDFFLIPIDSLNNFKLQNGDSLGIPLISNYFPTITINGWVKRPGQYPFIKGIDILKLIEMGGGLNDKSWFLPSQKRLITLKKYNNTKIITFDYDEIINGGQKIILNPFDEVQVLKNKFNNFNNYVSIKGEIKSEGIYSISNRTLKDIINDAGGFTSNAFIDGIELYRDTLRVGINSLSMIPINGDSLFVPLRPGSVTILGSVNNPGPIAFEKSLSINDFIALAGGYTIYANKKDVFIIYPNGIAKQKTRLSSPKVLEGSTIMVSASQLVTQQTDYLEVSQQIASIISSLATVALIISSQK